MATVGTGGGDGSGLLGAAALGHDYWLWTAHCKGGSKGGGGGGGGGGGAGINVTENEAPPPFL